MARTPVRGPLTKATLETVFLWTRDFKAMRAFYHDVLGLPITYENPHFANLQGRGASIALHAEREGHTRGDNWHIEFLVDDLDAVVAELSRRGVTVAPIREESFGRITTFRDSEGNEIGLEEPSRPQH
jgi:predicted enzyme related to lactoylglutathione lyase